MARLPVKRFVAVAMQHITRRDDELLHTMTLPDGGGEQQLSAPLLAAYEGGYLLWIPADGFVEETCRQMAENGFSSALQNILRQTAKQNCELLRIDCDAECVDDWELFQW